MLQNKRLQATGRCRAHCYHAFYQVSTADVGSYSPPRYQLATSSGCLTHRAFICLRAYTASYTSRLPTYLTLRLRYLAAWR